MANDGFEIVDPQPNYFERAYWGPRLFGEKHPAIDRPLVGRMAKTMVVSCRALQWASEFGGDSQNHGSLYSYSVEGIDYGFFTGMLSTPEKKVFIRFDVEDPIRHEVGGLKSQGDQRIFHLGAMSSTYRLLFDLIVYGEWVMVEDACREIRKFASLREVEWLHSIIDPSAQASDELPDFDRNRVFAALMANAISGHQPPSMEFNRRLCQSAERYGRQTYGVFIYFLCHHWCRRELAADLELVATHGKVDEQDDDGLGVRNGIQSFDAYLRRFNNDLSSRTVKELWRDIPFSPYPMSKKILTDRDKAQSFMRRHLEMFKLGAADEALRSNVRSQFVKKVEPLRLPKAEIKRMIRDFDKAIAAMSPIDEGREENLSWHSLFRSIFRSRG